jgi:hypothetical protein
MRLGNYRSEEWSEKQNQYSENVSIGIQIKVEDLERNQIVVDKRGPSHGSFSFTSVDNGKHRLCFMTNSSSWFASTKVVRVHQE